MKDYNKIVTKNVEQKQNILHVAKNNRRRFPDSKTEYIQLHIY